MKFFVDTADTAEIKSLAASGLLDGVTTNPSLIAKSGRNILEVIAEICGIVDGPVSAEVAATEYETMMREAAVLRKIARNVCIKLPLTPDGLRAHAQAMQDEADRVLAAGRAQAGAWARVQEAVLALIESRFPIDCIATEFPRLLAVDAANLCAEAPILAARRLSLGSIATLFGARSVVFEASEAWAQCLHGEASGLAQHQVLIRIPGHDALLALAARDAALLDPAQGQACWLFLARAVAAAVSR